MRLEADTTRVYGISWGRAIGACLAAPIAYGMLYTFSLWAAKSGDRIVSYLFLVAGWACVAFPVLRLVAKVLRLENRLVVNTKGIIVSELGRQTEMNWANVVSVEKKFRNDNEARMGHGYLSLALKYGSTGIEHFDIFPSKYGALIGDLERAISSNMKYGPPAASEDSCEGISSCAEPHKHDVAVKEDACSTRLPKEERLDRSNRLNEMGARLVCASIRRFFLFFARSVFGWKFIVSPGFRSVSINRWGTLGNFVAVPEIFACWLGLILSTTLLLFVARLIFR